MKTVVFICLLSLSLCLCQPTTNAEPKPNQTASKETKPAPGPAPTIKEEKAPTNTTDVPIIVTTEKTPEGNQTPPKPSPSTPPHDTKETQAKTDPKDNKTENKVEPSKETVTEGSVKPGNKTEEAAKVTAKPAEKKDEVTTVHPTTIVTSSEAPKHVTETPVVQARRFDGASFVGGIILALGLLAIGFMGFKYYKNQTERNYHTL